MLEGLIMGIAIGAGLMYLITVCLVVVPLGKLYDEALDYIKELEKHRR